jgi:hypothetical protein
MVNYEQILENIVDSLSELTLEFDIDEVMSKMELREIPKSELIALGENIVKQNFINGTFKIKLSDDRIVDADSLSKYCIENNIKQPILFVNPNFKYVRWELTEDFVTPQLKSIIKRHLANNNDLNLDEAKRALIKKDIGIKEVDGYIHELPVKTSNFIQEGKFYIQVTGNNSNTLNLIDKTITELNEEKGKYIKSKIKRDRQNSFIYFVFVLIIATLWLINNYCKLIPNWLSTLIVFIFFILPFVLQIVSYSFIQSVFNRVKAEKNYEKEFNEQVV